jgi:hypothetical protein
MKITKVCCQGCGADLDIDGGIRYLTCNYCGVRLEVVHDATVTHTRQLDRIERSTAKMAGNLKVIELQNDLELLDREWSLEREQLMIRNKDGSASEPGGPGPVVGGVITMVAGVVWIGFTANMGAPVFFPLFGFLFIGIAFFNIITGASKATQYRNSSSVYQGRRARLLAEIQRERKAD